MPDEYAVADAHAVADEGVALDLAALAYAGSTLHLHEGSYAAARADPAAVEVGERVDGYVIAELDVVDKPVRGVVSRCHSETTKRERPRSRY